MDNSSVDNSSIFPNDLTQKGQRTRQRILDAAKALFAEQGYAATTMRDIAQRADCSLGLAYRYFEQKDALSVAIYMQLADETRTAMAENLPMGTVVERFDYVMRAKFEQMTPHRTAVGALFSTGIHPENSLHVPGQDVTDPMFDVFEQVVRGANDKLRDDLTSALIIILYTFYLLTCLFWLYDRTPQQQATRHLLAFERDALKVLRPIMLMPLVRQATIKMATIIALIFNQSGTLALPIEANPLDEADVPVSDAVADDPASDAPHYPADAAD